MASSTHQKGTAVAKKQALPESNGKLQNKAYGRAMTRLREAHRDEFDKLVTEEYEAVGLVFRRRATAEERAERERQERLDRARSQYEKLLADYPELAAELAEAAPAGADAG